MRKIRQLTSQVIDFRQKYDVKMRLPGFSKTSFQLNLRPQQSERVRHETPRVSLSKFYNEYAAAGI